MPWSCEHPLLTSHIYRVLQIMLKGPFLLCSCFIFLFWTFDLEQILQLAVSKVGCVLSFTEAHATLKSLNKLLLHSSLHDHRHLVGEPFCFPSDTISCPVVSYFFVSQWLKLNKLCNRLNYCSPTVGITLNF